MVKKISLAAALIHAPRLLVLDEPFEAVDPVSGQAIRTILRRYVATGGTVVMSSHVMELVEGLCDRVAVIAGGRVLAADTIDGAHRRRHAAHPLPRAGRRPRRRRRRAVVARLTRPAGGS